MTDDRSPLSRRLRRLAARYEATVSRARAEQIASRTLAQVPATPSRRLRPVFGVAMGAVLTIGILAGLVVMAGSALPGDAFYSVKRASEALGLHGDPFELRLEEAIALANRNDRDRLMETAAEILQEASRRGIVVPAVFPAPSVPDSTVTTLEASSTTLDQRAGEPDVGPTDPEPAPPEDGLIAATDQAGDGAADDEVVQVIRLSAEQLLSAVRQAKQDPAADDTVEDAVLTLAMAVNSAEQPSSLAASETSAPGPSTGRRTSTTSSTTTTSTTTSSTTTSTTVPATTTTTRSDSSTTSTTVAGDGGADDGSESGDSSGSGAGEGDRPPITLPPP